MADKDFVVKHGLVVNGQFTANSSQFALASINSTSNGILANTSTIKIGNSSVNATINASSVTFINAAFTNVSITSGWKVGSNVAANLTAMNVGSNVVINTSAVSIGDATANVWLQANGLWINGIPLQTGGGYYKGNNGAIGNTNNKAHLFRIKSNRVTNSITISTGENAQVTGPLTISTGNTLTIDTGGRAVII
jgi:hypothetical protein